MKNRRDPRVAYLWTCLRHCLRLIAPGLRARIPALLITKLHVDGCRTMVHRIEESIGGRAYLIEVAPVSQDRWRACIARRLGGQTALMPFYGKTPDEAARHLSDWLNRAHRRAAPTSTG